MVVLIFRCPIKSFMISIGTPALTRNVAAKWRNDLNEWPWYPALLQALSISVLIAFVLAAWKNDWFFSIGQINKERTSFSFWHMGISTQYRLRPCFPWYPYPIRVFTSSMFSIILKTWRSDLPNSWAIQGMESESWSWKSSNNLL